MNRTIIDQDLRRDIVSLGHDALSENQLSTDT